MNVGLYDLEYIIIVASDLDAQDPILRAFPNTHPKSVEIVVFVSSSKNSDVF